MISLYQGIILTGGKSKRMGADKAFLTHHNKDFLSIEIGVLKKHTKDVIIVGDPNKYRGYSTIVVNDIIPDSGPIGGIYTGLINSSSDFNIVLSCDMPNIGSELIQLLVNSYKGENALICKFNSQVHPLVGIYNKAVIHHLKNNIESRKFKLIDILNELNCTFLNVPKTLSHQLININTREDYDAFLKSPID